MGTKAIKVVKLTDSLELAECNDGWWLYDRGQGMNLGMRCKTPEDAFVECIEYYQERLYNTLQDYRELKLKVDDFLSQFPEE